MAHIPGLYSKPGVVLALLMDAKKMTDTLIAMHSCINRRPRLHWYAHLFDNRVKRL
jgi:hypothetical protein